MRMFVRSVFCLSVAAGLVWPVSSTPEGQDGANEPGSLSLTHWVIASGRPANAGQYRLLSASGHYPAGALQSSRFRLDSGFFALDTGHGVFSDGFESGDVDQWSQATGRALERR